MAFSDIYFFPVASVKPKLNTRFQFQPQWSVKTISSDPVQTGFKTLPETDKTDRPKQMSSMSLRFSQTNSSNIPDMPRADR